MVYVVSLDEFEITGSSSKIIFCAVHKMRPSQRRMMKYAQEFQVNAEAFRISDNLILEE